jgi:putative effector of murein hydrolase LrgA (UPF0299 family)
VGAARAVADDFAFLLTKAAHRPIGGGLLGMVLLFMLCAAETSWLLPGDADAASIVAAGEVIDLSQ